jgi:hypothetical protein
MAHAYARCLCSFLLVLFDVSCHLSAFVSLSRFLVAFPTHIVLSSILVFISIVHMYPVQVATMHAPSPSSPPYSSSAVAGKKSHMCCASACSISATSAGKWGSESVLFVTFIIMCVSDDVRTELFHLSPSPPLLPSLPPFFAAHLIICCCTMGLACWKR